MFFSLLKPNWHFKFLRNPHSIAHRGNSAIILHLKHRLNRIQSRNIILNIDPSLDHLLRFLQLLQLFLLHNLHFNSIHNFIEIIMREKFLIIPHLIKVLHCIQIIHITYLLHHAFLLRKLLQKRYYRIMHLVLSILNTTRGYNTIKQALI